MSAVVEQRFTPWPFARAELELRVVLLDSMATSRPVPASRASSSCREAGSVRA